MPNFRPVDREKMNTALRAAAGTAAGRILRLAWQAGLGREEIRTLRWGQVDFAAWQIRIKGRTVPVEAELVSFLLPLREGDEVNVISPRRDRAPLTAQTVSHMARAALDEAGLEKVRLTDLRGDFARALLQQGKDWQAVSRITGLDAAALRPLMNADTPRPRRGQPKGDAAALKALLEKEGPSPAGLAVALAWQAGLGLEEIAVLRWEQVSAEGIALGNRTAPVPALLEEAKKDAPSASFVIATRTGRPYDLSRLSRLVGQTLVAAGLDNMTLRSLRSIGAEDGETVFLAMAAQKEGVTLRQVKERLGLTDAAARQLAARLCPRQLTRVGTRYYTAGSVVPPQEQEGAVLAYLAEEGFAYRQDIARLLRIPPAQCRTLLGRLTAEGKIVLRAQRYYPA